MAHVSVSSSIPSRTHQPEESWEVEKVKVMAVVKVKVMEAAEETYVQDYCGDFCGF